MTTSESIEKETTERDVAPGIWLMCSEMVIENEIQHKTIRQKDIAMTVALALRSEAAGASKPDWKRISDAVIGRWGLKGWIRVKEKAWKLARGEDRSHEGK